MLQKETGHVSDGFLSDVGSGKGCLGPCVDFVPLPSTVTSGSVVAAAALLTRKMAMVKDFIMSNKGIKRDMSKMEKSDWKR